MARHRGREDDDGEEEALSLSDLPIDLAKTEEAVAQLRGDGRAEEEEQGSGLDKLAEKDDSEFDFGWWGNDRHRDPSESHMCAADELFFKGQILPLRLSVSSENGLVCRSVSRSESMDHGSVSRFVGSRSSSIGSYHSSSSSSTNSSSAVARGDRRDKLPLTNNFHSHPSPKPRSLNGPASYRQASLRSTQSHNRSFLGDFFGTGLVRGPASEVELRDLKYRRSLSNHNKKHTVPSAIISRNCSNNSNAESDSKPKRMRIRPGSLFRGSVGGLLGANCKCSVETVTLNGPNVKMGPLPSGYVPSRRSRASEDGSKTKTKTNTMNSEKQAMSRRRTSEWLRELSLSHAS